MRSVFRKTGCCTLALLLGAGMLLTALPAGAQTDEAAGTPASEGAEDYDAIAYSDYMEEHGSPTFHGGEIVLTANELSGGSEGVEKAEGYEGYDGTAVLTPETGYADWRVQVPEAGYYSLFLEYFAMEGNGEAVERTLTVDGQLPFSEARSLLFSRVFTDDGPIVTESSGNQSRPSQKEVYRWQTAYVRDNMGYQGDRLYVYFTAGEHTLRLTSVKEPMAVGSITLSSRQDETPAYQEYLESWRARGAEEVTDLPNGGLLTYEAEVTKEKSEQTLYPLQDRASPATTPYSASKTLLNTIGGEKWSTDGQWISWEVDVPKSGFYSLAFRSRQNFVRGMYVSRCLSIDGVVPFEEAKELTFYYSDNWQLDNLGSDQGDYRIYLSEGKHEIRLDVTLGDLAAIISQVQDSLTILNGVYWDLVTVMGLEPDVNRDYHISTSMPEVLDTFREQAEKLYALAEEFEARTGQTDSYTVSLIQLARQMERMAEKESVIASGLTQFSDNIGALANWISSSNEQPLQLDKFFLSAPGTELPAAEKGFFSKLVHEFKMLASTFVEDYNLMLSDSSEDYPTITVWIGNGITGGRDQVQVLKRLITNDFTPNHQINVNLQLIPAGTLLSATLAGKGPDVSLQTSGSDPVNYAMRGAVSNLSEFEDYPEVAKRFSDSTLVPYTYLDGVYALPETQSFYMMFYRKDILSRLGIDPAQLKTWDDILKIIPDLQNNHLTLGLPLQLNTYAMFLYQMGGSFYRDDGKKSNLDDKISTDAFKLWSEFYTNYKLPVEYNFENRFRFGSMPIAIADYTNYNLLSISAPEIRGLWGILPVPGMQDGDTINNTAAISGAGAILMKNSKQKDAGWEFMKWWTSADVQVDFGLELESVLGPAARFNTANLEAIQRLPWSAEDKSRLLEQFNNTAGIPEVPGGYYTSRYVDFAIRDVTNDNLEPRAVLLSYVRNIDDEIVTKRKEFGLD